MRLLEWYEVHGRHQLPWRVARDPYYTLVSEFMLQQTQVDRVIPKFQAFIERFPNIAALAGSSVADVLRLWQGLGYNSRAVRLREVAVAVVERFDGALPSEIEALRSLPGIGPYTAAAIAAFAFNEPAAPIDTNIRRIVHRVFFGVEYPAKATPTQLDAQAKSLVPPDRGHDWNSAMMDLGATICTARAPKCLLCPVQADCKAAPIDATHLEDQRRKYAKKPSPQNAIPFEQTTRFARGRIIDRLRELGPGQRISLLDLHRAVREGNVDRSLDEIDALVCRLESDGLVMRDGSNLALRE